MGAPAPDERLRDFAACWNAGMSHVALAVRFKVGAWGIVGLKRRARARGLEVKNRGREPRARALGVVGG